MSSFASVPGVKRSCLILLLYFPESTAAAKFSWDLVWDGKQTTAHHPCAQPATSWKSLFSIYLTESSCNGILATVGICGGGGGGQAEQPPISSAVLGLSRGSGIGPKKALAAYYKALIWQGGFQSIQGVCTHPPVLSLEFHARLALITVAGPGRPFLCLDTSWPWCVLWFT